MLEVVGTLGGKVKERRLALGLTQVQLASRAGLPQQTISRIESGSYKETPPPEQMRSLAGALEVSVASLLAAMGYAVNPGTPFIAEDRTVAGVVERDPDDPRAEFHELLDAIRLDRQRVAFLRDVLGGMKRYDEGEGER